MMLRNPRHLPVVKSIFILFGFTTFFLIALQWQRGGSVWDLPKKIPDAFGYQPIEEVSLHNAKGLWKALQPLLDEHTPKTSVKPTHSENVGAVGFEPLRKLKRPDLIKMSAADVDSMRSSHADFLAAIEDKIPMGSWVPGTRGMVTTAGGHYLPTFVVSLRMLRRTGCTLPMELFMNDHSEYERHICEKVLPTLNARCVILSDILDAASPAIDISHYQLKVFSMIFSSFEDMILLDSDCFAIYDPNLLFDSEPYKTFGLITWPDFWISSISHHFYDITNTTMPAISERQSTESGEIVISKRRHHVTLMLSTYYNYHGPSHYFKLLSQGGPGEGDKDTFITAAAAAGESFYQVSERVQPMGHREKNGGLLGSAMVQYDPRDDYALTSKGLFRTLDEKVGPRPRSFFIHANFPKLNPGFVFDHSSTNPTYDDDGNRVRAWIAPEDTVKGLGYDVEKGLWQEVVWVACELTSYFNDWIGKDLICRHAMHYWERVFEGKE